MSAHITETTSVPVPGPDRSRTERDDQDATSLLLKLASSTRHKISSALSRHGMTWARYETLELLSRTGPSSCLSLARTLGRHRTTVGVTVAKLEQLRLVERTADPTHVQQLVIALTPAGETALARAERSLVEVRRRFNNLDAHDDLRAALIRLENSWTKTR